MCRLYRPQIRTVIRGRGSGPDERPESAADALDRAAAFYAGHGIVIERVLTDNGGPYRSRRYAAELERHGIRHKRTRPYRPQTNGKPSG